MALCPWFRPECPVKIHTPQDIVHDEFPPSPVVHLLEVLQSAEEGQRLDEDIGEAGIGFTELVA